MSMRKVGPSKWVTDKRQPEPQIDDRLELAGVNAVKQAQRIRGLEARISMLLEHAGKLEQELKVMTEARDHFADSLSMWKRMTKDERAVVQMFAAKMMGEGRREHGALDLATDTRSVDDLLSEALDEIGDGISYLLMAKLAQEMRA